MLTNCDDLDCPCTQLPQSTCTRDMFSCFSGRVVNISEHNTHLNCVDSFFLVLFRCKKKSRFRLQFTFYHGVPFGFSLTS